MGKDKGTRYTNDEREELLALYRQSGYGVSRFCKEMDISYAVSGVKSSPYDLLDFFQFAGVRAASFSSERSRVSWLSTLRR